MAPQSSLTLINLGCSTESQKLCEIQLENCTKLVEECDTWVPFQAYRDRSMLTTLKSAKGGGAKAFANITNKDSCRR